MSLEAFFQPYKIVMQEKVRASTVFVPPYSLTGQSHTIVMSKFSLSQLNDLGEGSSPRYL